MGIPMITPKDRPVDRHDHPKDDRQEDRPEDPRLDRPEPAPPIVMSIANSISCCSGLAFGLGSFGADGLLGRGSALAGPTGTVPKPFLSETANTARICY